MDDSMSKSLEKKNSTTKETKVVKDNKETKDTDEPTEIKQVNIYIKILLCYHNSSKEVYYEKS